MGWKEPQNPPLMFSTSIFVGNPGATLSVALRPIFSSCPHPARQAIIRYTPPKDDDLLCVVASYMINGVERTTKASPYVDSFRPAHILLGRVYRAM